MKKNAFTLIELLAVIVILAIIALIATPIVLNIIEDTKESAQLRSAEFYLDAVEQAIMRKNMNKPGTFKPTECEINDEGNLDCDGEEVLVEVRGEVPIGGTIKFTNGVISWVQLELKEGTIKMDENNNLEFSLSTQKYVIGEEITFDPGDGERTWNVIGEDETTVRLLLSENLVATFVWDDSGTNKNGPVAAMRELYEKTKTWINAEPVNYKYDDKKVGSEYGYISFVSTNGEATVTGEINTQISTIEEPLRARMLTIDEVFEIASKTNGNLKKENLEGYINKNLSSINTILGITATDVGEVVDKFLEQRFQFESKYVQLYYTVKSMILKSEIDKGYNVLFPKYLYQNLNYDINLCGYWTLSARADFSFGAWGIGYDGVMYIDKVDDAEYYGLRPVITVLKSKLQKS